MKRDSAREAVLAAKRSSGHPPEQYRDTSFSFPGTSGPPGPGPVTFAEQVAALPLEELETGQLRANLHRLRKGRREILAILRNDGESPVQQEARRALRQIDLTVQRIKLALVGRSKTPSRGARLRPKNEANKNTVGPAAQPTKQGETRESPRVGRADKRYSTKTASAGGRLSYRSEVKRAISYGLVKNPGSSDRELCRWLDAEGIVDLPRSWEIKGNRLFEVAYTSQETKQKIEVMISKVRKDMRKHELLP